MKKLFSYLIVIIITYAVAAYVNNKELRQNIQMFVSQKILKTQKIEIMWIKPKLAFVRKEPSQNAALLGSLKRATQVKVLKKEGEWCFIETPSGIPGWVKYDVLTSTMPTVVVSKQKEVVSQEVVVKEYYSHDKLSTQPLEIIEATNLVPSLDEPPEIIKEELKKQQVKKEEPKSKTQPQQEVVQKEKELQQQTTTQQQVDTTIQKPKKIKPPKPVKTETKETEAEEYIICPNCGAEVIKGERYCPYCREPLSK